MSKEEWLAFHANPKIEGLTAELTKRTYKVIYPCLCKDVFDVMNHHFYGDRIQFAKHMRKLGFNRLEALERISFYVMQPICIEMLAAFDFAQNIAVLETACQWFERSEFAVPRKNIVQLIDRGYPRPSKQIMPHFAIDFVISRDYARCGAIAVMGAARRRGAAVGAGWKDIFQIIARIIWSSRLFYYQ